RRLGIIENDLRRSKETSQDVVLNSLPRRRAKDAVAKAFHIGEEHALRVIQLNKRRNGNTESIACNAQQTRGCGVAVERKFLKFAHVGDREARSLRCIV